MQHRTAVSRSPPRGRLAALVALCLVCVARCRAAPSGEVSERQALRGADLDAKDLPEWWVPLFSPTPVSDLDGHLCGFAVRFGRSYLLAHRKAMDRILSSGRVTGVLQFKPETTIDLSLPMSRDEAYLPTLINTFEHDLGLYKTIIRPGYEADKPADEKYPMETSVCLQKDKAAQPRDCRLITYGDDLIGDEGMRPNGTRRLKMVGVVEQQCKGAICLMATEFSGRRKGSLCGVYSNLGNPIICGTGPLEKITYIVSAMEWQDSIPGAHKCSSYFRAVKVAHISAEVWRIHTGYMLEQVERAPPIPIWPG